MQTTLPYFKEKLSQCANNNITYIPVLKKACAIKLFLRNFMPLKMLRNIQLANKIKMSATKKY